MERVTRINVSALCGECRGKCKQTGVMVWCVGFAPKGKRKKAKKGAR